MIVDQTGEPSFVAGKSDAGAQAPLADIVTPTPPVSSFSQVVTDYMANADTAAKIVIDPTNRLVACATSTEGKATLDLIKTSFLNTGGTKSILTPEAGQTGVALKFNNVDDANLPQEVKNAVAAAVLPPTSKPKRSISSLISTVLGQSYTHGLPVMFIDQTAGTVTVISPGSNTNALSDGLQTTHVGVAAVHLDSANPTQPSPAARLVFEGGAV